MTNWPQMELSHPNGSSARISTYGAQLLSWTDKNGKENIFVSHKAIYEEGKAIRGGSPVIFPWFGKMEGKSQAHGFARNIFWYASSEHSANASKATLVLRESEKTLALWPYKFELKLSFVLDDALTISADLINNSSEAFEAQFVLHNYFLIDSIDDAVVKGLEGSSFTDKTSPGFPVIRASGGSLKFNGLVDRVYSAVRKPVRVEEKGKAKISIEADTTDVVTWNPGEEVSRGLSDLALDDYKRFVCVETGTVHPMISLRPHEKWTMKQRLVSY